MTGILVVDRFTSVVRETLFRSQTRTAQRIGAEVELIPVFAGTGAPCPLERSAAGDQWCTLDIVRDFGVRRGWVEQRSAKGAPYFALPAGGMLTFEPGGQLELCAPPCDGASELISSLREVLSPLCSAACDRGVELLTLGIDPYNEVAAVPQQLSSERYNRMAVYFNTRGPNGVRMMRQTAATQISVDAGSDPEARWRLLCDLAPSLTAIFANSRYYAGRDSGYQSFRARCWRTLDPSRTGVPHPELEPGEAYARFALDAIDMMRVRDDGSYASFADWAEPGDGDDASWELHLSTLFPEVRPRGYLEVRSIDALPIEYLAAPIVLISGLVYDADAAVAARAALPAADEALLARAALCGLRDPELRVLAEEIVRLGLNGAKRLGPELVRNRDLEDAESFFERWTYRGLSPADHVCVDAGFSASAS
jgi:glutamate--cysteine ligase